jgi:DNA-directed RNA polymerase subunit RPC12/RpoP
VVNGSNFQIEQQCPQCGAPIILDEADRILSCKFCRTRVYLAAEDIFRFYIPPAEGLSETIYFIPYWRIKGLSYTIKEKDMNRERQNSLFSYSISSTIRTIDISNKYFDINFLSLDSKLLPHSLGLRPQAMKLKFMGSNESEGKFLKFSPTLRDNFINDYQTRTGGIHKEIFIGETASVIYSPVYCANNRVYDALLKKPLDLQKRDVEIEQTLISATDEKWHVEFLPLLCPDCGADLPGEKDALIVFCDNCHTAWNPSNKNFIRVKYCAWREAKDDNITYLPFWQLKVKIAGFPLETYADLIKVANLPKAPAEVWTKTPFYFFAPAFKLNPALFLRWCRQLTSAPPPNDLIADFPVKKIHPVTLPVNEALESSLLTLVSLTADKRNIAELLPSLNFTLEDSSLVLHPFKVSTGELVHTKLGFPMDMNALNMGTYL